MQVCLFALLTKQQKVKLWVCMQRSPLLKGRKASSGHSWLRLILNHYREHNVNTL